MIDQLRRKLTDQLEIRSTTDNNEFNINVQREKKKRNNVPSRNCEILA